MRLIILLTTLLLTLSLTTVSAESGFHDGLWEITSETSMPGMPVKMPAITFTQCFTQLTTIPQQNPNQDCEVMENRQDGQTFYWKLSCSTEGGKMTSEGHLTYQGDSFSGEIITTGDQIPGGMTQTMNGKWVSDCPENQ